jgi:hypothetical protein
MAVNNMQLTFILVLGVGAAISAPFNQWAVRPINLDLSPEALLIDEQRYKTAITPNITHQANMASHVLRYESAKRVSFDVAKFDYVVSKNPRSVIIFKDTATMIVPTDDILDADEETLEDTTGFAYIEVSKKDILASQTTMLESPLIPASPCLYFNSKATGSVAISYSAGISIGQSIGANANAKAMSLSVALSVGSSVSVSSSFSGGYLCLTLEGNTVRLVYRVHSLQANLTYRRLIYDANENQITEGAWMTLNRKFLFENAPKFYCLTSNVSDLQCDKPGVEYVDSNGNVIEGFLT